MALRWHPPAEQISRLQESDQKRHQQAVERLVGTLLPTDERRRPIVAEVVRGFEKPLTLAAAASELGLHDPEILRRAILETPILKELGLEALSRDETVSRHTWEAHDRVLSAFQEAAVTVGLGVPVSRR